MSTSSDGDPVARVFGAAVIGAAAGGAVTCLGFVAFYGLRLAQNPNWPNVVAFAALAGLIATSMVSIFLTHSLGTRRAVIGTTGAEAGAIAIIILTAAADYLAGRAGLLVLLALCALLILGAWLLFLRQPAAQETVSG